MNIETQSSRRSVNPQTAAFRTVALAALCALASATACADPPAARAADTRVAKVSLAGLDFATPEGARAAFERIKATAEQLCLQLGDDRMIDFQAAYNGCVVDTLADTIRRAALAYSAPRADHQALNQFFNR